MTDLPCGNGEISATVAMTQQIDLASAINGRRYRIQIARPLGPAPAEGYPTLYVIDGDLHFGAVTAALRARSLPNELQPAFVVGIGYPEAEHDLLACLQRRNVDLTPTPGDAALSDSVCRQLDGLPVGSFGGADGFLDVIEQEIKPLVGGLCLGATGHDILFGHSLGGLFVLNALFKRPTAFEVFLSLSPSIWWDGCEILAHEAGFRGRVSRGEISPAVFVGVGEFEQSPAHIPKLSPHEVIEAAMVDNARALAERLERIQGPEDYRVGARIFEGQTHMAVVSAAMNDLLAFALPAVEHR